MCKIEEERVLVVLIALNWHRRTLYIYILGLLVDEAVLCPNRPDLLEPKHFILGLFFSVSDFNSMAA